MKCCNTCCQQKKCCCTPCCHQCCPKFYPQPMLPYYPQPPSMQPGSFTDFRALTSADYTVFQTAVAGLTGVSYTPLAVRTQVVNGTNYNFLALATTATNPSTSYYVLVNVYQALPVNGGTITLGEITPIHF